MCLLAIMDRHMKHDRKSNNSLLKPDFGDTEILNRFSNYIEFVIWICRYGDIN